MEQKFTIRPKPKVGESLSGYLIRISEMNCTKFWCVKNYIGVRTNGTSSLDTLPQRVANMPKLINLLGIDEESILKMTFWNLFNKFYSNINVNNVNFKIVISDRFVVHKRRFCANCLRESGYYRIVWQIRDIDMCDIHFTKIQSRCSLCGTEQPYISNSLGEFLCFKCGNDLSKQIEPIINDSNYINEQLKIINDWLFLLDEKFSLDSYSHEYGKEKILTIVSLYISQGMENVFDREKIYFFTSNEITGHIRFINNLNGGRCISLNKLLKLSRSFKIDLNGIFNLNVPETYITSLRNYRSRFEKGTLGVCLAPWCNSYKSNKSLVYINCYKFNRSNYFACVCKECFNKYGINEKTGKWDNMGGFIDLLWNKVLPSLKSGASLNSIKTKYKTSWERIINAIEYAVNHGLLDGELHEEYSVNNIPNNIISYFSYLYDTSGSMSKNARKCFKWNSREFYYYLNIKKVQRYLLFERDMFLVKNADNYGKSRRKKELEELLKYYIDIDKDINVGNVIIGLNCSDNTIYRNKLENIIRSAARKQAKKRKALKTKYIINKVKEYFREKDLADDLLTCSQVYKDLKICNGESGEEKKEIRRVVSSKVKEYNTEVKSNRIKKLNKQLDKIVKQFYILGKNATYKEIAFQLGISQSTLDRNTVLKKAIRETIKKYYY